LAVELIKSNLWRWTAPHPEWQESSEGWTREVGCVFYEAADAAVFIDPLVPIGGEEDFWRWADERCHAKPVYVLTTISFHRRSRDLFLERYQASTSRAKANLPPGVESRPLKGAGETMFWLPGPRALIPGDRLICAPDGSLRMCPESWLTYLPRAASLEDLRALLTPLLELPIESVLVSHGAPLLSGGRSALARALA
jgi:hypothetical protein